MVARMVIKCWSMYLNLPPEQLLDAVDAKGQTALHHCAAIDASELLRFVSSQVGALRTSSYKVYKTVLRSFPGTHPVVQRSKTVHVGGGLVAIDASELLRFVSSQVATPPPPE